ncbi:MAG: LAGLIDADG family homing endonuclease, partial [Candidatus Caldarchaeum sp.]
NDDHLGQIQIANTNLGIIRYTAELLERLGIESKIYKRVMKRRFIINGKLRIRRKKIIYALTIQRKVNIIRYRSLIGFSIKRKQSVLEMLKDTQRPITL